MSEVFGNHLEEQSNRDNKTISVFDEQKYTNQKESFYNKIKNNSEDITSLKDFIGKQNVDKKEVQSYIENLKENNLQETRDNLDREAIVNEARAMLYEKLGIDNKEKDNSWGGNFSKGLVDTLLVDNTDLAIQVWETNGKVIIDGIKEAFSSWENIKKLAEALGESVMGLFSLDGYETGKSLAELGLIGSGVGIGVYTGKKTINFGMKQASKFRKNTENIVENIDTKKTITETNKKVNEIVPKQEVDVEELVKEKFKNKESRNNNPELLPEKIKKLELELDTYSEIQLNGLKNRLGLNRNSTIKEIELAYRFRLANTLERYKKVSDINLKRFENQIIEFLEKKGIANQKEYIDDEILKLEIMKDKGELLIVSAIPEEAYKSGKQLNKFSQIDNNGMNNLRDKNYLLIRENTEKGIGSYGLDPKYASFLVSKVEINNIKIYGGENPRFIGYNIDELEGRAGITVYDSMLSGKISEIGDTKQMIEYTTENLIKSKMIYNIDEKLGFPLHSKLIEDAVVSNNGEMKGFFEKSIKPYIEIHIYGGNTEKVKNSLNEKEFLEKYFNN